MTLDCLSDCVELLRQSASGSFLAIVPFLIFISPTILVSAGYDFPVYRMQQFDLHSSEYGSRSSVVSYEARVLSSPVKARRCILIKLMDISSEKFRDLVTQPIGALVIILPQSLQHLSDEEKQRLMELENDVIYMEILVPVYVAIDSRELSKVYDDVSSTSDADYAQSATEALLSSSTANGFQLVVNGPQADAKTNFAITNIMGKLSGLGAEEQLPTIAIVAHYDSFGFAPSLAIGSDSNASGVVVLLELARIFAKLYSNSRTHAKHNILFLLSGGGKFNYQGTKRWLEDHLDSSAETSLLPDAKYILCLDSLAQDNSLYLHVSKPPKPGSHGAVFVEDIKASVLTQNSKTSHLNQPQPVWFQMQHKKINLNEQLRDWEHEGFSIRRLPAFTLSHFEQPKNASRFSITDIFLRSDIKVLTRNIEIIAGALIRNIFSITNDNSSFLQKSLDINEKAINDLLVQLTSGSRAAQILDKDHWTINFLYDTVSRYIKNVKKSLIYADKQEPDFVFYSGEEYIMSGYRVKPAIFDLFLAVGIGGYLFLVFLFIQNFQVIMFKMLPSLKFSPAVMNGKMSSKRF